MASIKDVAHLAGVGVGTVSRVINNTGYVSKEAQEKIDNAMNSLNYTPNELARNLFHKQSKIVAVLVPTISHPFFAEFVNFLEIEFHEKGYKTMICNTAKDRNYELDYLQMLKSHIVDGIITGVHSLDIQEYLHIDMPIVALDRYIGDKIPVVSVDHKRGGLCAAKELIRCGCKKILQFEGATKVESPAQERHKEFAKTIIENGIELHTVEMEWNKFDIAYFNKVAKDAYQKYEDIDGVFGTDLLALSYMRIAQENGKNIPDDLKVVAYDGTQVTEMVYPSITTVKQPIERLAKEAVRLMIHKINGTKGVDSRIELEAILVRGKSTEC